MRTCLVGLFIFIASTLYAQRPCATSEYTNSLYAEDPAMAGRVSAIENFIQQQVSLTSKTEEENIRVVRIPVVVHVLYNNALQNISDAQVISQINVLNRDFRRLNADTIHTPTRFKSFASDVQIEFVLATADPQGRPTSGIVRKATQVSFWNADDKIKMSAQGGDDPWDVQSYLNIWVGNLRSLLGYSSVIGCAPEKDGVVINYTAFGTINTASPFHLGRTTVHEVGHWLGLKHIWGDTYCGDDGVHDTPTQGNFTAGCPSGIRSSCNNGTNGDMYMNFMDYTDDACVNLFTSGQKDRMQAVFNEGGPRHAMLASKGAQAPWNEPSSAPLPSQVKPFSVYPNPVLDEVTVDLSLLPAAKGHMLSVINAHGAVVKRIRVTSASMKVNFSQLSPGIYFLQLDFEGKKYTSRFARL